MPNGSPKQMGGFRGKWGVAVLLMLNGALAYASPSAPCSGIFQDPNGEWRIPLDTYQTLSYMMAHSPFELRLFRDTRQGGRYVLLIANRTQSEIFEGPHRDGRKVPLWRKSSDGSILQPDINEKGDFIKLSQVVDQVIMNQDPIGMSYQSASRLIKAVQFMPIGVVLGALFLSEDSSARDAVVAGALVMGFVMVQGKGKWTTALKNRLASRSNAVATERWLLKDDQARLQMIWVREKELPQLAAELTRREVLKPWSLDQFLVEYP